MYLQIFGANNFFLTLLPALLTLAINVIYGVLNRKIGVYYDFDTYFIPIITSIVLIIVQQYNSFQVTLYSNIIYGYIDSMKNIIIFVTEFLSKSSKNILMNDTVFNREHVSKYFNINQENFEDEARILIQKKINTIKENLIIIPEILHDTINKKRSQYYNHNIKEYLIDYYIHEIKHNVVEITYLGGMSKEMVDHTFDELNLLSHSNEEVEKINFKFPPILFYETTMFVSVIYNIMMAITMFNKFGWPSLIINYIITYVLFGFVLTTAEIDELFAHQKERLSNIANSCILEIKYLFSLH